MKAMLVLCLAAAVYARPSPGFAYTVVDPTNLALNYAIAPSVYTIPQQPIVYAHTPIVYTAPAGCRNNDGKRVACIGEAELKVEEPEVPEAPAAVAVEQAPVAVEELQVAVAVEEPQVAVEEPAIAVEEPQIAVEQPLPEGPIPTEGETKIISVKRRDAQVILNTANNLINPFVYTQHAVAPIALKSCINNQGSIVPCSAPTQVAAPIAYSAFPQLSFAPQVPFLPLAAVQQKVEEVKPEEVKVEEAKVDTAIVEVKKREAEPQILLNSFIRPTTYIAHTPIVQVGGCRNSVGSIVPCA